MFRTFLHALAGSAALLACPIPPYSGCLPPAQLEAGYTLSIQHRPRPEYHVLDKRNTTRLKATPIPIPNVDVGCVLLEGHIIATCHLIFGGSKPGLLHGLIDSIAKALPSEGLLESFTLSFQSSRKSASDKLFYVLCHKDQH